MRKIDPNMDNVSLRETSPFWASWDTNATVVFLQRLIPLLISGLQTRRKDRHEHALLLSALTHLHFTLDQVVVPVSSHPSLSDLEFHLANTCGVLDYTLRGRLHDISKDLQGSSDVDMKEYLYLPPAESVNALDTITSLTRSLERCKQRKRAATCPTRQHSYSGLVQECRNHWRTLFRHLSQLLAQSDIGCTKEHEVRILLSHVCQAESSMSFLMSECAVEKWYRLKCDPGKKM